MYPTDSYPLARRDILTLAGLASISPFTAGAAQIEKPMPASRVAARRREGTDVTVVALGALVPHALRAARELEADGVSTEIIDPRTLAPLDTELIAASVAKTGKLVVAHEATQFCGFGSEIAAHVAEHCFWDLDGPVVRVGAPSHPIPYQKDLEAGMLPGPAEIARAAKALAIR